MMFRSLYVKRQCFQNSAIQTPLWPDALRTALYLGAAGQGWLGRQGGRALHHPDLPTTTPGLSCALTLCKTNQFLFFVSSQADEYFALTWLLTNFCTWPLWEMWKLFFFFSWYDTPSSTVRGVDYKYTKLMQNIIAKKLSLSRVSS